MSSSTALTMLWFNALAFSLPVSLLILYLRPSSRYFILALYLGVVVAMLDRATTEVQLPAFFLLTFGAWLGFCRPQGSWLWGILLGAFIPLVAVILTLLGQTSASGETLSSFAAFIPPTAGSLAGAIIRRRSNSRQIGIQHQIERELR